MCHQMLASNITRQYHAKTVRVLNSMRYHNAKAVLASKSIRQNQYSIFGDKHCRAADSELEIIVRRTHLRAKNHACIFVTCSPTTLLPPIHSLALRTESDREIKH